MFRNPRAIRARAGVGFVALLALALIGFGAPVGAASAALSFSPTQGTVGTTVPVTGSGFSGRTNGTVTFGGTKVASFTTDKVGGFKVSFKVPAGKSGTVPVVATAKSLSATKSFTVLTSTAPATTTTTAPTTTSTTTPPPSSTGFVGRNGKQLVLNGASYRFTGLNSPDLTTDYAVNYGCGESNTAADVSALLGSLRPNSMVRVWAFQHIAWSKTTNSMDFATMDRVVNAAAQKNQKLIMVLAHQWGGGCGEFYKTESWYATGYRQALNDGTALGQQTTPLSYYDWVGAIVARYANSPAIGMWEPMNEPNPTVSNGGACSSTAAQTLRQWFDAVGGRIHSLDSRHLVASGVQGSGQCGAAGTQYQTLHQSPGIDVGTIHDYYAPNVAMPGDQWNGVQTRINQMAAVNKPLFVEEVGINASNSTAGQPTLSQRRDYFKAKMDAQLPAMVGYVPWTWSKTVSATNYHIAAGDPTLTLLRDYAL